MATQFQVDCALMAGRVYEHTRTKVNYLPIPDKWLESTIRSVGDLTGFEASYFQNTDNPNNIARVGCNSKGANN